MPYLPPNPCKFPGCPEFTREGFCRTHKEYEKAVKTDYERLKDRDPFYKSPRWIKLRNWYAKRHPLCEECLKIGREVPMKIVDHIIDIKDGGDKLSSSNLQSLCQECHNRKTGERRRI